MKNVNGWWTKWLMNERQRWRLHGLERNLSYWHCVDNGGQRATTVKDIYHVPASVLGTLQSNLFSSPQNISIKNCYPMLQIRELGPCGFWKLIGVRHRWLACQEVPGSCWHQCKERRKNSEASHRATAWAWDTYSPEQPWEEKKWILW